MAHSTNKILEKVYASQSDDERRQAYDEWAVNYDKDVTGFGIQLPYVGAAVFARHVEPGSGAVLDAACGTGMHTLPLFMAGYGDFHGIDISDGMLKIAEKRGCYDRLSRMTLGKPLDFKDDHFTVSYCIGALAHGHAPPDSLYDLIRVTRPGGLIIWSTHAHENERTRPYHDLRQALTSERQWIPVYETPPFVSMPDGDAAIKHAVYVYEVCS